MHPTDSRPIETIRLSDKDKAKLINQIDAATARAVAAERRSLRVRFTAANTVVMLHQPNGVSSRLSVLPRNLSKRGMAFVHGRFVYPDVKAEVTLPTIDGELVTVAGVVRNCRHISGIVHEISIVFDDLIDLALFVEMTPEEERRYREERAEDLGEAYVEEMEGDKARVLLVEGSETDRKLYRLWLSKAGLEVVEAGDAAEAKRHTEASAFDVVVLNAEGDGVELLKGLRGSGLTVPVVALTNRAEGGTADGAMQAGCSSVLAKPFQAAELEQAVGQLTALGQGGDEGPLHSTASGDPDMAPLVVEYVEGMAKQVQQLRGCLGSEDWSTLEGIGQTLRGSSGSYGFEPISEAAGRLLETLGEGSSPEVARLRQEVDQLIGLMRRAKA